MIHSFYYHIFCSYIKIYAAYVWTECVSQENQVWWFKTKNWEYTSIYNHWIGSFIVSVTKIASFLFLARSTRRRKKQSSTSETLWISVWKRKTKELTKSNIYKDSVIFPLSVQIFLIERETSNNKLKKINISINQTEAQTTEKCRYDSKIIWFN